MQTFLTTTPAPMMEPITYNLHSIPSGAAGVRATLRHMAKIVRAYKTNPHIRELALELTRDLPPKKWSAEAARIHAFVRDEIRYIKDIAGVETLQTPVQTLRIGQGDCDDKSILVASLLQAIGHPVLLMAVGFSKGHYSHVLPYTKIAGKWIALETTEPWPMGKQPPKIVERMVENI